MPRAAGWGGRVVINGDAICYANKWSVDYTVETDDGTGTAGNQIPAWNPSNPQTYKLNTKTYYPKLVDIGINLEAFYDTSHGWIAATPAGGTYNWLYPGRSVSLTLYPARHEHPGRLWHFSSVMIMSCNQTTEVRGVCKISFTAKNNSPDYIIDV